MWVIHKGRVVDELIYLGICKDEIPVYSEAREHEMALEFFNPDNLLNEKRAKVL